MFFALARFAYRFRWPVLAVYLVLLPPAAIFGSSVFSALQPGGYDDPSTESYKAQQLLQETFGLGSADLVPLYTVSSGSVKDEPAQAAITAALDQAARDPAVERVLSFYNTGAAPLVSPDNRRTFAVLSLRGDDKSKIEALERLEGLLRANSVETSFGGEVPVFRALNHQTESDLQRGEMFAFPITAVLLVIIFGSVVAAGVPLVMGGIAIVFALALLRGIALVTDLSAFALNVITVLGLGLAIDYSLFILNRYREELHEHDMKEAIITAVGTTGRAAAFSGVTLAASLVGLFVFPQTFLRSMAIGGIAVTLIAVLLATTFLPALVAVLGPKIDLLRMPWVKKQDEAVPAGASGFWHVLAMGVMRRPVLVAVVVVVVLLALGSPFLRFRATQQDYRALAAGIEPRDVSAILDTEFLPHETTPINVVLSANGKVLTPERIGELFDYVQWLSALPGITRVDSLFTLIPGQPKATYQQLFTSPEATSNPVLAAGIALFASDTTTRASLVSAFDFDASRAQEQVAEVRAVPPPLGMTAIVGGNAAELVDTKASIRSRTPLTLGVIGLVTFIVLFLVYGSITLPIKAMLMNLLSLTASAGIVVWIFQDGRFEGILGYTSLGTLDVTLPILLFGIVFGLSMDYEVLMLSRIREEYLRTGDNTLAVALGLEKTGRLITSAAALLIVVILAFATSGLTIIKAIGIGMALAIAIDATIVRALLVPAAMRLMGDWNWWAPAPLKRLWEKIGLGDLEGHAAPALRPALATAGASASVIAPATITSSGTPMTAPIPRTGSASGGGSTPPVSPTVTYRRPPQKLAYLVQRGQSDATFRLTEEQTGIGRDASNQVVLADQMISAFHARIVREPDGAYLIEDRGSSNGTYVNDQPLTEPRRLTENDAIRVGDTVLTLKVVGAAPVAAPVADGAIPVGAGGPSVAATVALRRPRRALVFLVQTEGESPGTIFPLKDNFTLIGRDPRNDVIVADALASGFHARIMRGLDGGVALEDLESTNGTTLNGLPLEQIHHLEENDQIQIGNTVFQFKVAG